MFNQEELIKEFLITVNYMGIGIFKPFFFWGWILAYLNYALLTWAKVGAF